MPAKPGHRHGETTQFDTYIFTIREFRHVTGPSPENLFASASVRTNTQRTGHVIKHDGQVWKSPGEVSQFRNLGMIKPRIE